MIKNIIKKMFPNIDKLLTILRAVDTIDVTKQGSLYIKLKKDVAIEAKGNIVTYTKEGVIITKSKMLYVQPKIESRFFELQNNMNFIELKDMCHISHINAVKEMMLKNKELEHDHTTDKK